MMLYQNSKLFFIEIQNNTSTKLKIMLKKIKNYTSTKIQKGSFIKIKQVIKHA